MPSALVDVFLADSAYNQIAARSLTTNGAGQFMTTFSFDRPTLPVRVAVLAWPELGSGLAEAFDTDSTMRLAPGQSSASLSAREQAVTWATSTSATWRRRSAEREMSSGRFRATPYS